MKVQLKFCGMTRIEDALESARAGVGFLGYIFHEPSKRNVSPAQARAIIRETRLQFPGIRHVGVFVDKPSQEVQSIIESAGLDYAQLHGTESPEDCSRIKNAGIPIIKVLKFALDHTPQSWKDFDADFFLCDTYSPTAAGGTGHSFQLQLLPPDLPLNRTFLAGGLTCDNVADVLSRIHPFGLDVSSGLESAPGIKCPDKIRQFARIVSDVCNSSATPAN